MALGIFAAAFEKKSFPPYTRVRWRGMVKCRAFATKAQKSMFIKTSFAGALVRECTDIVWRNSLRARRCSKVVARLYPDLGISRTVHDRKKCCSLLLWCARSNAGRARAFNPLWGHCQEYKFEKNAILQERLLSEKRSTFVYYNLTLSESFCLTDHEKQIQKFVAHWKVCQKSSQREVIRKNAYIAPKPQSVLLPALHLKFSRSLTNFQASLARHSPLRSKDRRPSHAVV